MSIEYMFYFKFPALIIILILILSSISPAKAQTSTKKSDNLLEMEAKSDLLSKELIYLKEHPMSEELKLLIRKLKSERRKRSSENMYIIKDGKLMPLKNYIKNRKSSRSERDSYTVLPLVIPHDEIKSNPFSNYYNDKIKKSNDVMDLLNNNVFSEHRDIPRDSQRREAYDSVENPSEFVSEKPDSENKSQNSSDSETLQKILQDVEDLVEARQNGNKKDGRLCSINGSWVSEAGGTRMDICFVSDNKFRITLADLDPPAREEGFLCSGDWNMVGQLPFNHSGVVVVVGLRDENKHIATFLGECRVCDGIESVTGTWLVGRNSRDCKDQKVSHQIFSDSWHRENVNALHKKHLEEIGYTESGTETT